MIREWPLLMVSKARNAVYKLFVDKTVGSVLAAHNMNEVWVVFVRPVDVR